ncbi:Wzz/FepE/Etk N-terminal domain-containing protein [Nocardioides ochotonae]|uniref:Wzz/FepE/Etk N-terminal domain-containing protein n=1 Tax=Nocardioides ochotonae TaxID=2685869 RepID=UPI00140BCE11|nr:Wzz/FepE/Etk N-terminal domain-containing protein [Nocardioides ochotonae]
MHAGQAVPDPWGLGRYARVLRRRWVVLLVCAALGAGLGAAYAALRPSTATAAAMVNLNVISQDPFDLQREPSGLIDAQTEVQTVRSSEVVSRAAEKLGDTTPGELRSGLRAEVYPDATVLRLTYTAGSVQEAVAGADRIAVEFLAYRGNLARQRVANAVEQLSRRRDLLRDDVLAATREIAEAPPGSRAAGAAAQERDILNTEIEELLLRIGALSAIETTGGTVITTASDIGATTGQSPSVIVGGGLLAGLLLGLVLAFARDALDGRVRDEEDLVAAGSAPLLATLPQDLHLPARGAEQDALLRVWQFLGAALAARATPAEEHRVLAVLDATGRDDAEAGLPTLGAALTLAAAGQDGGAELVLVGVPQHRMRTLATELHLEPDPAVPAGDPAAGTVSYRSTRHPQLRVRWLDPHGGEAGALSRFGDALTQREALAARTVVCLGPAAGSAGRMVAARVADAVLVVTRTGRTRRADLAAAVADVVAVEGQVLGTLDVHGRPRPDREHARGRRGAPTDDESSAAPASPVDAAGDAGATGDAVRTRA